MNTDSKVYKKQVRDFAEARLHPAVALTIDDLMQEYFERLPNRESKTEDQNIDCKVRIRDVIRDVMHKAIGETQYWKDRQRL
jgi:hypothetical protein